MWTFSNPEIWQLEFTVLEIYNEDIKDLLDPKAGKKCEVCIRRDTGLDTVHARLDIAYGDASRGKTHFRRRQKCDVRRRVPLSSDFSTHNPVKAGLCPSLSDKNPEIL